MKKEYGIIFLALLVSVAAIENPYVTYQKGGLERIRSQEGLNLIDLEPYVIPGGTSQYMTPGRFKKAQMRWYAERFPYDLNAAVVWVRTHYISLADPITKRSLLVSLMSDEQIKAYLLQPRGMIEAGILEVGLPSRTFPIHIVTGHNGRLRYEFDGYVPTPQEDLLSLEVSQNINASIYRTPPPQNENEAEEIAWVRLHFDKVFNPSTGRVLNVDTAPISQVAALLKISEVRQTLGLPYVSGQVPSQIQRPMGGTTNIRSGK
ncbi:MAG TPA: hypothetical protein VJG90_09070 [Candidatus Nanoarchaeia archaeon]|nr:hypothetical protein [Candidatus Nanoarchaeia archaeon]